MRQKTTSEAGVNGEGDSSAAARMLKEAYTCVHAYALHACDAGECVYQRNCTLVCAHAWAAVRMDVLARAR